MKNQEVNQCFKMIIQGNCIEKLKELPDNSVDAIVTDPPYGLEFMGKNWDYGVPGKQFFIEMIRVLKPGAFLLAFGGTRTYHRLACGIEDAGFEIRDCIQWLYGSGFPKSLNIGKQIDKIQGNEREEFIDNDFLKRNPKANDDGVYKSGLKDGEEASIRTKGTSAWEGWGTALKPANEPIVVARKPLSEKNVALNVLKWGTGGINIDACRIGTEPIRCSNDIRSLQKWKEQDGRKHKELVNPAPTYNQGRFPANIILDEEAGKMLDEQSGVSKSGKSKIRKSLVGFGQGNVFGDGSIGNRNNGEFGDVGGASRFFYCAKASKKERNLGCEDFEEKNNDVHDNPNRMFQKETGVEMDKSTRKPNKNNHPTVKPIKLMEYLIKLVSKEGATILDPFMGSGTTGCACANLNRKFIGIEKEEEYIKIAEARIKKAREMLK